MAVMSAGVRCCVCTAPGGISPWVPVPACDLLPSCAFPLTVQVYVLGICVCVCVHAYVCCRLVHLGMFLLKMKT